MIVKVISSLLFNWKNSQILSEFLGKCLKTEIVFINRFYKLIGLHILLLKCLSFALTPKSSSIFSLGFGPYIVSANNGVSCDLDTCLLDTTLRLQTHFIQITEKTLDGNNCCYFQSGLDLNQQPRIHILLLLPWVVHYSWILSLMLCYVFLK